MAGKSKTAKLLLETDQLELEREFERLSEIFSGPGRNRFQQLQRIALSGEREKVFEKLAKVKYVLRVLSNLKKSLRGRKLKGSPLKVLVAAVRKERPGASHREVAETVDSIMRTGRYNFANNCPSSWTKVQKPPRSLTEALAHKTLKARVKSFISRAIGYGVTASRLSIS